MTKKMLINATHPEEHRVAIVEDGVLTELDIEISGKEQTKGNIYKAVVTRVETGLQAAFVDYGSERLGFLQIGEIHPSFFRGAEGRTEDGKRPRINDLLRRGQEILVQIVKEERGTKGAALTTFLSLPGRYMVLMPESDTKGISRKIEKESDRKKLREIMDSLEIPDNMGYIVRTAGSSQKKADLKRDVDYLLRLYEKIQTLSGETKAPALIYKESNLVIRSIRDYFSDDMDEVLVDDARVSAEARDFFREVMPEYAELVKLHQERRPIFARYQIEEQIDTITKNKVMLPSGGSIVIDTTEALVAIDVNSGKMASEQGVEATAYKSNLEAAVEVARQLRLRDLGGLVVIDFIDMRDRKHIREVEKTLKDAMKMDKARVTIGRISQFGLLEMSRQRIKSALAAASFEVCPHCNGSGKIKTVEARALAFLRRIHAGLAKGHIGR
ncbi:MAG: Rne/Rng family ribonuclease, partial [Syntrophotalea acetylenica]|nr:Rne/Rng family ribonuclease [Syntrophotalea acetylenica]